MLQSVLHIVTHKLFRSYFFWGGDATQRPLPPPQKKGRGGDYVPHPCYLHTYKAPVPIQQPIQLEKLGDWVLM